MTGGGRPASLDRGWFVKPTVLADVDNSATIAQEEIFGPVLLSSPCADLDDAIRIANDSDYGLGGSVWTADAERGKEVARWVRTGTIGINKYLFATFIVASSARSAFTFAEDDNQFRTAVLCAASYEGWPHSVTAGALPPGSRKVSSGGNRRR